MSVVECCDELSGSLVLLWSSTRRVRHNDSGAMMGLLHAMRATGCDDVDAWRTEIGEIMK